MHVKVPQDVDISNRQGVEVGLRRLGVTTVDWVDGVTWLADVHGGGGLCHPMHLVPSLTAMVQLARHCSGGASSSALPAVCGASG